MKLNHDMAVMLEVQVVVGTGRRARKEWKHVWRLCNIVGMRVLKEKLSASASEQVLATAEILKLNPNEVSIEDPAAVFTVRWYHECNAYGDVLPGFQNRACKGLFHLPTSGELHAEPIELVSNHAVLEAVQMQKAMGHIGIWEANQNHLACVKEQFKKALGKERRIQR